MSVTHSLPVRTEVHEKALKFAFALYGALSLVSMAPMNIGAAVLAATVLLTSQNLGSVKTEILQEWRRPLSRLYFCLSLLLTASVTVSLVYAKINPLGYGGKFVEVHFFSDMAKVWYLFWPCFLLIGFRRLHEKDRRVVFKSWVIAFGCLSVLGMMQYFTGWPRKQPIPLEGHFHASLFLGHHLSVASIFIFPFFATLDALKFYLFRSKENDIQSRKNNKFWVSSLAIISFCGLMTLFFTYSRTLWVALPVGLLVWILWSLPKEKSLLLAGLLIVGAAAATQIPEITRRITIGMGTHQRKDLWQANLEFFKQRPLTGVGWHHTQELSGYYLTDKFHTWNVFSGHAHNNFLEMLGGTGILGTTLWIAWCLGVFMILLKNEPTQALRIQIARGLVCAWIVFHINGLTQVNFWEGKVEHQMAWAIVWSLL